MPDGPSNPGQQLADALLAHHGGDARAALAELARMYLVARHGWSAGFDRAPPAKENFR